MHGAGKPEGRLIVVSNRVPLDGPPSGGLVVALDECLAELGGIWIGAREIDGAEPGQDLADHGTARGYRKLTFDLTPRDRQEYYLGFANGVLWPLCHRRADLIDFRPDYLEGYMRVNRRLAAMLAEILRPGDRLWIHDYHFLPLAACLRELGVEVPCGFFLHIPFPTGSDLDCLSDRDGFLRWIAAFDLVGLQSQACVANCLGAIRHAPRGELYPDGQAGYEGRRFRVASFPIGIDAEGFARDAIGVDGRKLMGMGPHAGKLIIGVDRLDYSKGLPQRVRALSAWLDQRREDDPRATLLQIAPPTREELRAYQAIRDELELLAGAENGKHGQLDWMPVRYIHRAVPRESLAPLYRAADVGLVTPLADGMNLVAKEFVAAQDPEDPGVLVLSRFAGAAEQLTAAVIVNPYDLSQMTEGLAKALRMPLEERRERHAALLANVQSQDIGWWARNFLAAMDRLGQPKLPLPA